jgi:hypothetical protein
MGRSYSICFTAFVANHAHKGDTIFYELACSKLKIIACQHDSVILTIQSGALVE